MGTKQYFYSGVYTVTLDWSESVSDTQVTYQPILTATSSGKYGDAYIPVTWDLTVDGVSVSSGSGDTNYYGSGMGYGPWTMDTFSTRTVTRTYGTAHTIRLREVFTDWYGAGGKKLTVDGTYTVQARPYDLPAAPSGLTATRVDDANIALAWTNNSVSPNAPWMGVQIERSNRGGAWQVVTTAAGDSAAYTDTSVAGDGAYSYRICAINPAGSSAYTTPTATVYTTPVAPGTPIAQKTGATEVTLAFSNTSLAATGLEAQYTTDGGSTWSSAGSDTGIQTSFVDANAPSASAVAYRVRNVSGTLYSAWSNASNTLAVLAAPNPPTITLPQNYITALGVAVRLTWRHNPVDGSAQSAYSIKYSSDNGGTWTIISKTTSTNQYHDLLVPGLSDGDTVLWQVRTWGLDATASDWSSTGSYISITAPVVSITSPATDPYSLTSLPLAVTWSYVDGTYQQASATVTITDSGSAVVYTQTLTGVATTITLAGWQPDNMETYGLALAVKSSSTLVVTDTLTVDVNYNAPAVPSMTITETDGKALNIAVAEGIPSGSELPTDTLALYRVVNGESVLLADGLHDGETVTDYLPPMDEEFTYRLLALSTALLYSVKEVRYTLSSHGCAVWNYGAGFASAFVVPYDVKVSEAFTRDGVFFWGAGMASPAYLGGAQRGRTWSVSGSIIKDDLPAFRAFADVQAGVMWFRAPGGIKSKSVSTFSMEQAYINLASIKADITRVV